jgi:imidazolonepropionase
MRMTDRDPLTLWRNARLATCAGPGLGLIERGALMTRAGRIVFAGPEAEAPAASAVVDCEGRWITPALIDCHTHLVYGGDRAREFELRLAGASYEEIAKAGGGIVSTVIATRAASEDELVGSALKRLDALIAEGVGAVEIKSGYGLDLTSERKMLRAARRLGAERDVVVRTTFLGAHALPPEYSGRRAAYVDLLVDEMLPALAAEGLVDAVDGFCETIAFSREEIARVFDAARRLKLPVKLHAEQLSNQGGAALAASYGALSADHLEWLDDDGAAAMAKAGTVAALLPGAFYTLRETKAPPVDALRRHGVAMAVATDSNPGTSPLTSLLTALTWRRRCFA